MNQVGQCHLLPAVNGHHSCANPIRGHWLRDDLDDLLAEHGQELEGVATAACCDEHFAIVGHVRD